MTTPRTIPADPKPGERYAKQTGVGWDVYESDWLNLAAQDVSEADARLLVEGQATIDRLVALPEWIVRKLKTMTEYYTPPTDGRDIVSEIQGWMHVLCFHYEMNRREVKEYDAARREAKRLVARVKELRDERDLLARAVNEQEARIAQLEAALKPFAVWSECSDETCDFHGVLITNEEPIVNNGIKMPRIMHGDVRRAAALLADAEGGSTTPSPYHKDQIDAD